MATVDSGGRPLALNNKALEDKALEDKVRRQAVRD
jgi:hypothetical protein